MNIRKARNLVLAVVAVFVTATFTQTALASGSAGGGGGVSKFGQEYTQGKAIFFKKVACDKGCPLSRKQVTAEMAKKLVSTIRSRDELGKSESEMDKIVALLKESEVEKVEHYLARRFNIKD